MRNGLYKVSFATQAGAGNGVVVLHDGKVQGGDTAMFYNGSYHETGNQFQGTVDVKRHSTGMPSVFGVDAITIHLNGTTNGDSATVTATSPQAPSAKLSASLSLLVA